MTESNTNPLADLFALVPSKDTKAPIKFSSDHIDNLSEVKNTDIKYARDNIVNLIEVGQGSLMTLAGLAEQSQMAGSYEVIARLIKTLLDANKDLIEIHQKNDEMNKPKKSEEPANINNQLIIAPTSKIAEMIENRMKGK